MAEPGTEIVGEVERRLEALDQIGDPEARAAATAVVQAVLELYGAGLERIVETVAARDTGDLAEAFADDELISHLLLLHGLHPASVEERVLGALEQVRPYLGSHGGDVELVEVAGATVRLALQGSCNGCPSSTATVRLAIEEAIRAAAPEIDEVVAEEPAAAAGAGAGSGLLQIELAPAFSPADCPVPGARAPGRLTDAA